MSAAEPTEPAPSALAAGWSRLAARTGSIALMVGGAACVLLGVSSWVGLLAVLPDAVRDLAGGLAPIVVAIFLWGMATTYLPRASLRSPRPLRSPVRGRWSALNGPATKVPSHGLHLFAQTYAIDLVYEPEPGARPSFGGRKAMRDPRDYPAFGQPVYAPAAGIVAAVHDRSARDHRARSNLLGFLYMMAEGVVLQFRGAGGAMGNRIVLDLEDGTLVAFAHLQRGSARVRVGDRVEVGEVLAAVGNSGNSSEPHLHLQVMDHVRPGFAAGVPFTFTDVVVTDALAPAPGSEPVPVVPEDRAVFHGGISCTERERRRRAAGPS